MRRGTTEPWRCQYKADDKEHWKGDQQGRLGGTVRDCAGQRWQRTGSLATARLADDDDGGMAAQEVDQVCTS